MHMGMAGAATCDGRCGAELMVWLAAASGQDNDRDSTMIKGWHEPRWRKGAYGQQDREQHRQGEPGRSWYCFHGHGLDAC